MNTQTIPEPGHDLNDRVAASLRHMVDEADHLLKTAVDTGDQKASEAYLKLKHQLHTLRLQLNDLEDGVAHRTRQAARRADEAVHSHPYGAMGIAAAAGLLVGVLLARR